MPKQQTIDRIVAQLLQQFPSVTDETVSRTTGFTMQQVALARYRAQKSVHSVQAPQQALAPAQCHVAGCDGPMQAGGMCWKHYQRERRKGNA